VKKTIILSLLLLFSGIFAACGQEEKAVDVNILFLNVGRADAALIEVDGMYYMVDTGTKDGAADMIKLLSQEGVEELQGVFISHSHSDHMGGLESLSVNFPIETVYRASVGDMDKEGKNKVQKRFDKLGLSGKILRVGNRIKLASEVYFEVLGPSVYNDEEDNDNSLILMLHANGKRILFTGDMEFSQEEYLLKANTRLQADVLKVGNHGNPDATGEDFAKAVSPSAAVISTDRKEDADSANSRVFEALSMAKIYVTDESEKGIYVQVDREGTLTCDIV